MANIETAYTSMFSKRVLETARQKTSRLRACVEIENISNAEDAFFEGIGDLKARRRTTLLETVNLQEIDQFRRKVIPNPFEVSIPVPDEAKARLMIDVQSDFTTKTAEALGREMDFIIIEAMLGGAQQGKTGQTTVNLRPGNVIGKNVGGANTSLSVEKLRVANRILDEQEVPREMRKIYAPARAMQSLLSDNEAINSDFATVKALVNAEINEYMGFEFVRGELAREALQGVSIQDASGSANVVQASTLFGTPTAPTDDAVLFFQKAGTKVGVIKDITTRVDYRPDILAEQITTCMDIG
ncbi:MAG: phage capsid protein, partial [Pseudomonadota bacterium]